MNLINWMVDKNKIKNRGANALRFLKGDICV